MVWAIKCIIMADSQKIYSQPPPHHKKHKKTPQKTHKRFIATTL